MAWHDKVTSEGTYEMSESMYVVRVNGNVNQNILPAMIPSNAPASVLKY